MDLLGDVGHVESDFFLLETVLLSVQDRCTVCAKHTNCSKIILDTSDGTPSWWGLSETLVHLEIVLILTRDTCTVCIEHTIGSKIILDSPKELLGDVGHVESRLFLFGDSVSVGAR
jgi:hypothetical protein